MFLMVLKILCVVKMGCLCCRVRMVELFGWVLILMIFFLSLFFMCRRMWVKNVFLLMLLMRM